MSSHPSTPVKVPASAAGYTPATQDPDLRSQINALLLRDGHVQKIQEHLLHSLNAHSANWPTMIQSHALALLRSGEVTTFPALVKRVMEDVRQDTALAAPSSSTSKGSNGAEVNGTSKKDSKANGAAANGASTPRGDGEGAEGSVTSGGALALPASVIEDALKVTRESLEMAGIGGDDDAEATFDVDVPSDE